MTTQRDVYTDRLASRTGPPDTYRAALERLHGRRIAVVGRMPTAYELAAYRGRSERRAALWLIAELVAMFVAGFVAGFVAFR